MLKRLVSLGSFGLVLPFAACGTGPSEQVASSSSDLSIDAGSTGGGRCLCMDHDDPTPAGRMPGSTHHCGGWCAYPVQSIEIAPGQTDLGIVVEAGVDWINPAGVTFSVSSLPTGVTAKYTQTSGYIPPDQGIAGAIEFSASLSAPPVTDAIVWITAQSGTESGKAAIHVTVGGTCVPQTICEGQCGSVANGCSGTLSCGLCSTGYFCNASHFCQQKNAPTCPAGTHSCGDGTCARICQ